MLWHAMPPELNTARLMVGAGPAPMMQAAAGWEALGTALEAQALELSANLLALKESWTGASSDRAIAAATPTVAWLQNAAQQAQDRAMKATSQAASYVTALGMTPSLPDIAANHITNAVLTATNFLGINLVPIAFNEADYFVRMWNQAAAAMDIYQAETVANTIFEPVEPLKPILQPGMSAAAQALGNVTEAVGQAAPGALQALAATVEGVPTPTATAMAEQAMQLLGQAGQLSGPMQQLTSLAGQTRSLDGMGGDGAELGGPGETELGQVGLLGASPLSNHPLAGGSGPSAGMGLLHAESLPGAGGSEPRTSMMSQLIDKPVQGVGHSTAGAGSSAVGGSAPLGMMGPGAQSGAGSRPGLATPALVGEYHDEIDDATLADLDDQDDW
jgi:PPE-repeat protein